MLVFNHAFNVKVGQGHDAVAQLGAELQSSHVEYLLDHFAALGVGGHRQNVGPQDVDHLRDFAVVVHLKHLLHTVVPGLVRGHLQDVFLEFGEDDVLVVS